MLNVLHAVLVQQYLLYKDTILSALHLVANWLNFAIYCSIIIFYANNLKFCFSNTRTLTINMKQLLYFRIRYAPGNFEVGSPAGSVYIQVNIVLSYSILFMEVNKSVENMSQHAYIITNM